MSDMQHEHTINIEADDVINRLTAQIAKLTADLAVAQASSDAWMKRAITAERIAEAMENERVAAAIHAAAESDPAPVEE